MQYKIYGINWLILICTFNSIFGLLFTSKINSFAGWFCVILLLINHKMNLDEKKGV